MRRTLVVLMLPFVFGGCLALGVLKMGQAQKEKAVTEQKEAYDKYSIETERLNIDLHKNNLPTRPIKTFEEWKGEDKKPDVSTETIKTPSSSGPPSGYWK